MTTTSTLRRAPGRTALVLGAAGALMLTCLALAGPAVAIEDPSRPAAQITHGPSCGPGGIRVQVRSGSQQLRVALVFDGAVEQDVADLTPRSSVELHSPDVDWGMTVDVSVRATRADGTLGETLEFGTYTRPTRADCDAVWTPGDLAPSSDPAAHPVATGAASLSTAGPADAPPSRPAVPVADQAPRNPGASSAGIPSASGSPDGSAVGAPQGGAGDRAAPGGQGGVAEPAGAADAAGTGSSRSVAPGGVVTLRASGFTPGEDVYVSMPGLPGPLATVTAAADGTVEAVVQIPRRVGLGPVTVHLVGQSSTLTTGLDLEVAARAQQVVPTATTTPAVSAGAALLVAGGGLGLCTARRPRARATGVPLQRN